MLITDDYRRLQDPMTNVTVYHALIIKTSIVDNSSWCSLFMSPRRKFRGPLPPRGAV